jgi:hypothetical protein
MNRIENEIERIEKELIKIGENGNDKYALLCVARQALLWALCQTYMSPYDATMLVKEVQKKPEFIEVTEIVKTEAPTYTPIC